MKSWSVDRPGIHHSVRIHADELVLAPDVVIGAGSVLVGDRIDLGAGTVIGPGCDLRAAEIRIGPGSEFSGNVRVLVAEEFSLGAAARIESGVRITCRSFTAGNLLYFGEGSEVGFGGTTSSTAVVTIGSRVTVGQRSILNANLPITIGNDVGTGSYLAIWTHGYHFGHGPLDGFEPAYAPVTIEDNVWLGFQITILPGVSVGRHTMVAAGAVVAGSLPEHMMAGGVPAKVKKPIAARKLTADEAMTAVSSVVERWALELGWKGHHSSRSGSEPVWMTELRAPGAALPERMQVTVQTCGQPVSLSSGPWHHAVVFVDGLPEDFDRECGVSFFDVRAGLMGGPRTRLSEDLRNELRRNAMPCGDTHTFTSVEPEPFRRLATFEDLHGLPHLLGARFEEDADGVA
ncbi:DapH/DapD/GlmU-related protein [Kitasatospora cineracea]